MSKTVNGLKWRNGREICRLVCNELTCTGMSVVEWVDMSDKEGSERQERREFNLELVFLAYRAKGNGEFGTVLVMNAMPQDGRLFKLSDSVFVHGTQQICEEDVAVLLHNVVDDDSEPQYALAADVLEAPDECTALRDAMEEAGYYVSEGWDDNIAVFYGKTEWPFEEEERAGTEGESRSDWNKNASILRIKDMLESMPENAVHGVELVVEVMHG